jgi:hypothetical protein
MRKKLGFAVGAIALTFVLSSCWALQSFTIGDYTLDLGQATKARFVLRDAAGDAIAHRVFVLVGIGQVGGNQNTDIGVTSATWGTNGVFGGPQAMAVENDISTVLGTDCTGNGLNFADITGVQWKAFATPTNKNDKNQFEKKIVIDAALKAKAAAVDPGTNYSVWGVVGSWIDDGDGTPEVSASGDSYQCWGISTAAVLINT